MERKRSFKKSIPLQLKANSFKFKPNITTKNAERERSRVKSLRQAFQSLQSCLPSVPPNTKLSKLDVLILATNYISYLTKLLSANDDNQITANVNFDCHLKILHPIKKWPMRSRLYASTDAHQMNFSALQDSVPSIQNFSENNFFNYFSLN